MYLCCNLSILLVYRKSDNHQKGKFQVATYAKKKLRYNRLLQRFIGAFEYPGRESNPHDIAITGF